MSDFSDKHLASYEKLDNIVVIHSRLLKQLQTFLLQTKEVQSIIYNDYLEHCSVSQQVLREIIDSDVNRDTIMEHDDEVSEMVRKEEKDFYGSENHHHK